MKQPRLWILILVLISTISFGIAADDSASVSNAEFQAQFRQGQELMKTGKYKEAISALHRAEKLRGNRCPACSFALALAYIHTGQLDEASKSCDSALRTAEDDAVRAASHSLKGTILLGMGGGDPRKLQAAEVEQRTAVQLDAKMALYRLALAKTLLRESKDSEAKEELQSCLALNPDARTTEEARLLLSDPRRGREEFAPDFAVTTLQGQTISLKELGGRIVVLDFWATWCPPCRESVPELRELARKYPSEKLALISVSADDDDQAWRSFIARKNMDWAQYRDSDKKIRESFHVNAFPTYLVIDGDGIIRQRIVGLNPQQSVVQRLKDTLQRMPKLEGEVPK